MERSSKIKSIFGINENIWAIIQRYNIRVEIVPHGNCSRHASIKSNSFLDPQAKNGVVLNKSIFSNVLVIPVSINLSLSNNYSFKVKNSYKALQGVKLHLI